MTELSTVRPIMHFGIERYMEDRIVTLRRDGVQQHEIGAHGIAYMIAVMDRRSEVWGIKTGATKNDGFYDLGNASAQPEAAM